MEKKAESNKMKFIILYLVIIIILLSIGFYGLNKVLSRDTIYEGIKIENINVGNMTREEAISKLKGQFEGELSKKGMELKYKDFDYEIKLKDLGYRYMYEDALDEAYNIGREGNVFKRIKSIIDTKKNGKEIKLNTSYDTNAIDEWATMISDDINLQSKDAQFNFNGGNMKVTQEVVGRKVDTELLKKKIEENIEVLGDIEIPVEEIQPNMTSALLSRINGIIGQFSTSFKTSSSDRKENIRVSSKAINGQLIMPGETASFNNMTGPRTKEKGYKEANIILEGEFIPGVGGGVCQMSTTLYNALIRADLTIVQRSPHSIPSTYVPYGQDAAVSYGHLDLKFRNDFDFPIYINSFVKGDQVFVNIYGDVNVKNYTIKIDSEIVETIKPNEEIIEDKNLAPGEKKVEQSGRTGYKVKTYSTKIRNGQVIEKKLLNSDFYKPRKYIYKFGPGIPKISEDADSETSEDTENTEQQR